VILHVHYTARSGGQALAGSVVSELHALVATAAETGMALLFSLPHDFPSEWSAFANGAGDFTVRLRKDYFPYLVQSATLTVDALELYAPGGSKLVRQTVAPSSLVGDLNGPNRAADLSIPADASVLVRSPATQVFLLLRYHPDA
jgi:hypothetical protein